MKTVKFVFLNLIAVVIFLLLFVFLFEIKKDSDLPEHFDLNKNILNVEGILFCVLFSICALYSIFYDESLFVLLVIITFAFSSFIGGLISWVLINPKIIFLSSIVVLLFLLGVVILIFRTRDDLQIELQLTKRLIYSFLILDFITTLFVPISFILFFPR